MKKFFVCIVLLIALNSFSQSKDEAVLIGRWEGTSICQIKTSPCNNEYVVYYISKMSKPNFYSIKAFKIANGIEEEMGDLDFEWNNVAQTLVCKSKPGAVWTLTLSKKTMYGNLIYNNQLYRTINLRKSKKDN